MGDLFVHQVSDFLFLSESQVRTLCRSGKLPAWKKEGRWSFSWQNVVRFSQRYPSPESKTPEAERLFNEFVKEIRQISLWERESKGDEQDLIALQKSVLKLLRRLKGFRCSKAITFAARRIGDPKFEFLEPEV
ncbi:hypothetical protein COY33_00335 [candidate division WWE3 bacterium CG_4_10_14_0_2_um_filter_42_7]|uniref:Helix-turn-helix domain-containing protein n=2 Tax=Katanobacteria TaxID=422282 RepID=A0A2H0XA28_UNCKA|nr:MAG: hypothetical protein COT51_01015 [candidate division WWE3 bacterium CG08_land_8_20_14_0_20_41_15]PIZ44046.1 MAG: hypothetical protein COY33_00335 [candidate division WWE3 bacterium CG_4_10_14_0_2_um_filter_42_7]